MTTCYLYPIPKCAGYKKRWHTIIYNKLYKLHKSNEQIVIVDNIKDAYLIFCVDSYMNQIYIDNKDDFDTDKRNLF